MGKSPSILQGPKTDYKFLDLLNAYILQGKGSHGPCHQLPERRFRVSDGMEDCTSFKEENDVMHYLAIERNVSGEDF